MSQFNIVTLGDSVAWGQGLLPEQKFNYLAANQIADHLGLAASRPNFPRRAHSGATVERSSDAPQQLDPDRHAWWPEVPWSTPTVLEQTSGAPDDTVDLVIITAGINDAGFKQILNPANDLTQLDRELRQACYVNVKKLLRKTRQRFPQAVIVATGYYPLLSEYSDLQAAKIAVMVLSYLARGMIRGPLISQALTERVARQTRFCARRQLYWLRLAVMERHADPITRGPGVLFAHPAFGPQNSIGTAHALLFSPRSPNNLEDWWQSFREDPLGEGLQIDPNDPVEQERRAACRVYQDREEMKLSEQIKCRYAALGHPNQRGARQYADAIFSAWQRNHHIALREGLEPLSGNTASLSIRKRFQRYGLDETPLSIRDIWQFQMVDSLAIEIRTQGQTFAGTNQDVYLQVAPDRKWLLNEKIYDGDLFDDFRPGATTRYTIDPAEGTPNRRLHLGEISQLGLMQQFVPSLPTGAWKPDWLRLEINGREVFRQSIDTSLQVSISQKNDRWMANYPS